MSSEFPSSYLADLFNLTNPPQPPQDNSSQNSHRSKAPTSVDIAAELKPAHTLLVTSLVLSTVSLIMSFCGPLISLLGIIPVLLSFIAGFKTSQARREQRELVKFLQTGNTWRYYASTDREEMFEALDHLNVPITLARFLSITATIFGFFAGTYYTILLIGQFFLQSTR